MQNMYNNKIQPIYLPIRETDKMWTIHTMGRYEAVKLSKLEHNAWVNKKNIE